MKKLIYIGGYGRSGSTLLERIIASHPKVIGCGELHNIVSDLDIDENCGCGKKASTCPIYKNIFKKLNSKSLSDLTFINEFYEDKYEFIVDSSKTTVENLLRPVQLEKNFEVYFIFLKRKLMPVIASQLMAKSGIPFFIPVTTFIGRCIANLQAYYYTFHFDHSLMIKYEELISDPDSIKNKIGKLLDLSFEHLSLPEDKIPTTHQLSGNAIRYENPLYLRNS